MKKVIYLSIICIFLFQVFNVNTNEILKKPLYVKKEIKKIKDNPFIKIYTQENTGLLTDWISDVMLYDKYIFMIYDILQVGGYGILNKETEKIDNHPMVTILDNQKGKIKEKSRELYYIVGSVFKIFHDKNYIYFLKGDRKLFRNDLLSGKTDMIYNPDDAKIQIGSNLDICMYKNYFIFTSYPYSLALYDKEKETWSYIKGLEPEIRDIKMINNKIWVAHNNTVSIVDLENNSFTIMPVCKILNLSIKKYRIKNMYFFDDMIFFFFEDYELGSKIDSKNSLIIKYNLKNNKYENVNVYKANNSKVNSFRQLYIYNNYFIINYLFNKKKYLTESSSIIFDFKNNIFVSPNEFQESFLFVSKSIGIDEKYLWIGTSDVGLMRIEKSWIDKVMKEQGFKSDGPIYEPLTTVDIKEETFPLEWVK